MKLSNFCISYMCHLTHVLVRSQRSLSIPTPSVSPLLDAVVRSDQVEHIVFVNMASNFKVKGKIHTPSNHISINEKLMGEPDCRHLLR